MALKSPSDNRNITLQFLVTSTLLHQRRMEKRAVLSLEKNVLYLQTNNFLQPLSRIRRTIYLN